MPNTSLPPFYYHAHFVEMLTNVRRLYETILAPRHLEFIGSFQALSRNAQCLYIRMANRRGYLFSRTVLVYPELDVDAAIEELLNAQFVRKVQEQDFDAALCAMTKENLFELALHRGREEVRSSWSRARLLKDAREGLSWDHLSTFVNFDPYVAREHHTVLSFLVYLYFGRSSRTLKSFALRDLGLIAVRANTDFTARFTDAAEAEACFVYSSLLLSLKGENRLTDFIARVQEAPSPPSDFAASVYANLIEAVGIKLEKLHALDSAIALYRQANAPTTNERLIRLLYKSGDLDEARQRLEAMIDDPSSDSEFDFACDFYARKFKRQRVSASTALLRTSATLSIDEIHRSSPEIGAANLFARSGWKAYWTENWFWHCLFGLLFWDELFGPKTVLHSEFDDLPKSLAEKSFHTTHATRIAEVLEILRSHRGSAFIQETVDLFKGQANGLIAWDWFEIEPFLAFVDHGPSEAIATFIGAMTQDFYRYRDGFPDLMLVKADTLRFVEIKAEGDVIRRNQMTRLRQLQRAGFDAAITSVNYRFDPEQTYVVVDIETTGGKAETSRIIEIGAVKMRNHEIIEEWQSLINPGCRIPQFITGLTGIDDSMVENAPAFSEIADRFFAFMENSVFVAHNVNFDYGFMVKEFERLERRFRFPKFCTCAGMRRHYPGNASYSLGNLCHILGFEMDHHHRALSDARAAAHLLILINKKRLVSTVQDLAA